jgi:hypothetical protein
MPARSGLEIGEHDGSLLLDSLVPHVVDFGVDL